MKQEARPATHSLDHDPVADKREDFVCLLCDLLAQLARSALLCVHIILR